MKKINTDTFNILHYMQLYNAYDHKVVMAIAGRNTRSVTHELSNKHSVYRITYRKSMTGDAVEIEEIK